MTISTMEAKNLIAPFNVVSDTDKKKKILTVIGFSQNDPLGVGGGLFPDMPTAYFEGGGWILASDLFRYYSSSKEGDKADDE